MAYSIAVARTSRTSMSQRWLYASIVLLLFAVLVVGIPVFPDLLAVRIAGELNLGALVFLILHLLTPALAFFYLRQRRSGP